MHEPTMIGFDPSFSVITPEPQTAAVKRHPAPPRVDRAKVKAARKRGRKGRNR